MRVPRITVRRMMAAVAILGSLLGAARMIDRRNRLLQLAEWSRIQQNHCIHINKFLYQYNNVYQKMVGTHLDSDPEFTRKALEVFRAREGKSARWVEYYAREEQTCRYLASHPWIAASNIPRPPGREEEDRYGYGYLELPASLLNPDPPAPK